MLPETLSEDDQVALTRLATLLAGDAAAGRRLLARSAVRRPDQEDLVDAADYPYESSRRRLIGTFLSRRGSESRRSRADRIRHAVAVLSYAEELGPESVARTTGLSAARIATELDAAPPAADCHQTWAPLLETAPVSIPLDDEIDRQARLQRRGRRRAAVLVGVAALVLAATIVVPSVVMPRLPREPHDPDTWAMVHTVEPQEGWSVVSRGIMPRMELTAVSEGEDSSPSEACYVRLFAPRLGPLELGFDPGNPPGEEFRLDGRPAWFAERPSEQEPPTVFWLYADEAWATFVCLDGPDTQRDDLVRLARSVSFEPQQVDVPVRFPRLADGHRIEGVTMLGEQTIVALATGGQNAWTVVITPDTDQGAPRDDSVRIGDRMARYNPESQNLCLTSDEPVTLCLGAHWNGTAPPEDQPDPRRELVRIAERLEQAPDLSDRSTWFDARDAFP